MPGDIPLVTSAELHRCARRRSRRRRAVRSRLRPSRQQLRCAAARHLIPLRFGNDSFLPHCEAMRQTGKPLVILELPGIGLDIDNPHELDLLLQRDGDTHAQRLLRAWGYASPRDTAWEAAG